MASDANIFIFTGRLGAEPEFSYSPNGKAYCKGVVACNANEKQSDGSWVERADWHNVVAFDKTAEILGSYKKGQPVLIQGYLKSRKYDDNGKNRTFWEVVISRIERLDRARREEASSGLDEVELN